MRLMTGPIHPPSSRGNSDSYRVIYDDMLGLIYFIFNVIKKKGSTGEVYLLSPHYSVTLRIGRFNCSLSIVEM